MNNEEVKKGLVGIIADETQISKVMPESNSLTYRGYPVQKLCEKKDFIDVAYLLFNGELPNDREKEAFIELEKKHRSLPPDLLDTIKKIPTDTHPMEVVRTAVSYLGCHDTEGAILSNKDLGKIKEVGIRLLAQIPTIVATFKRLRSDEVILPPNTSLDYVSNFFHMFFGKNVDDITKRVFDISMILYAEHGFNASTFTARVVTSTESNIYGAITAAIASLQGPLHGGANEAVMHTMLEIGSPDKSRAWIREALAAKKKIMGFGHRVYRTGDSRVPTMKQAFFKIAEHKGETQWCRIYEELEDEMKSTKNILPNLDFPTGPAYYLMGFDIDFFTPFFVMSRITGWTAHILEQMTDNKLIRPSVKYIGVAERNID